MAKTRHMHKRMSQRGINQRVVKMVREYGFEQGDKKILDKTNIDKLLQHLDIVRKDLIRVRDKGGVVVVEVNDEEVTTYRLDSFDPKKAA